jgi:energy-coupling factor transport system ATP-binding protein
MKRLSLFKMNAIEVKNLSFSYEKGKKTIDNVSFSVKEGEYVSIIGHNGSGKSTIAKLICYLLEPESGEIFIFGKKIDEDNVATIRKDVGIVFQNPDNQFIGSTVEDDIAFGLENRNVAQREMKPIINKFASEVGMKDYLSKEPSELSGGQKQRVAIAGVLALGLKIIIFDEATSMLDPEGVKEVRELIEKMRKKDHSLTFLSITHDMDEAYASDRVLVINRGKIYSSGTPEEIFKDEKTIEKIGLSLPFVMKFKKELRDRGIDVPKDVNSIESLGEFICH